MQKLPIARCWHFSTQYGTRAAQRFWRWGTSLRAE